MSEKKILIIDDSATIRRLVDSELGQAGYQVIMAPTAEQGIESATLEQPDLILLDHQLPGTTGSEVCRQLLEIPGVQSIPVIVSSTLRNKAYVEYASFSNVIDMLPKPYTGELLRMTVANGLETAKMVVHSQTQGSAVPEVIDTQRECSLQGSFKDFSLRELLDFLNNGEKTGRLEIEMARSRVSMFLAHGRIQGVTASGIDPETISEHLPEAICDLAPMIKFTLRGRNGSEVAGISELLDNKVLDARMLRQLLRHQSAILFQMVYDGAPATFLFEPGTQPPSLFAKIPLDLSLLALTVEASLLSDIPELTEHELTQVAYLRAPQRGQNLDRAGLSASQMKLLNLIANPTTLSELAQIAKMSNAELYKILRGFVNSALVTRQTTNHATKVIVVTQSGHRAKQLVDFFGSRSNAFVGRCVRDCLAAKLLSRRLVPDVLLFDLNDEPTLQSLNQWTASSFAGLQDVEWIGLSSSPETIDLPVQQLQVYAWPQNAEELEQLLHDSLQQKADPILQTQ